MRILIGIYNRNRKIIWFVIGMFIAIITLIRIVNSEFKNQQSNIVVEEKIIEQQFYDTKYSVVSSQKSNSITTNEVQDIIEQFIKLCNNKETKKAYDMLSIDCKQVLFPTIQDFETKYYNVNFSEYKTYKLQAWITFNNKFIYKIDLIEDILTTGKGTNETKQDYYTVVKADGKYYLNILGFIEKNSINSSKKDNSIEIIVESEEVFIDYLNLNITVNNKTKGKILLDSGKSGKSVYILDSENVKYISYLFEKNNYELEIPKKSSKNIKVKFMKNYKVDRQIKSVSFEDIVLNYESDNSTNTNMKIEM